MKSQFRRLAVLALASLLALSSGAVAQKSMQDGEGGSRPVAEELNKLAGEIGNMLPPDLVKAAGMATQELVKAGIAEKALKQGATIPSFSLKDAHGQTVNSSDILAKGPAVIVFYRGAWCPFCNLYLKSMQKQLAKIQSYGASLVAISGENPDNSLTVEQKNELKFTVLSDSNLALARKFGIVYEIPKTLDEAAMKAGINFKEYYHAQKAELPISATYVVDRKGKVVFAFVDPDFTKRAEPADIFRTLQSLK